MEDTIFKYVLDYGSLGVMSGLLFWLYLQNSKQMEKIREQAREDEEKIRDRFAVVIAKYDQERDKFLQDKTQFRTQVVGQLENLERAITKQEESFSAFRERIDHFILSKKD